MRYVNFKGARILINANVLTPFFYKQQFNRDFYEDAIHWMATSEDFTGMKITWALSKSENIELIDYEQWILLFDKFDTDWESIEVELYKLFKTSSDENENKSESYEDHYETKLIISLMRQGITLNALGILLPQDISNAFGDGKPRKATQADIDEFLKV